MIYLEIESYKRTTLIDEGNELKWDVNLNINNKKITGFVGLLKKGGKDGSSRKNAGFSVGRNGRMLYCAPNFFKPTTVFGQEGGTNNLVNQRVFGHLEFENTFGVTQAKDHADHPLSKTSTACYALIAYQTAYLKAHYPAVDFEIACFCWYWFW